MSSSQVKPEVHHRTSPDYIEPLQTISVTAPEVSGPTAVAATASSLGRETEDLSLANLAARVAAAARRVLNGSGLDPRRDISVLQSAERLLRAGAEALGGDGPLPSPQAPSRQESYAFARITHSALSTRTARPQHPLEEGRRLASKEFIKLADELRTLLDERADETNLMTAALDLNRVFGRISSAVLGEMGRPGDSVGGTGLRV